MVEVGEIRTLPNQYREDRQFLNRMRYEPTHRVTPDMIDRALRLRESGTPKIRDLAYLALEAAGYY